MLLLLSVAVQVVLTLVGLLLQGNRPELAAASYERALRCGFGRPSRCHNGAQAHPRVLIDTWTLGTEDCRVSIAGLGLALSMMQQDESALSHFTSAIELDPNDPRPLHNRAAVYKRLHKFTQAAEDSAAAAALDPGDKATARCGSLSGRLLSEP